MTELEMLSSLKALGIYSYKCKDFEVVFKLDDKKQLITDLVKQSVTTKSVESELYEGLDKMVNIPQLTDTV